MKKLMFFVLLLFLLVGCADELPPTPPAPGGDALLGRAIGGMPITQQVPSWAGPIKYTDISPVTVRYDENLVITVEKTSDVRKPFFVYAEAYALNKQVATPFWEKALADPRRSGTITQKWVKDKAVFVVPVSQERFVKGANYVLVYWCVDLGTRDAQGRKEWDCNSRRWGLGAFEVTLQRWPDILLETDLTMYTKFKFSEKITPPSDAFTGVNKSAGVLGEAYRATYLSTGNIKTEVTVIKILDVPKFKLDLSRELSNLRSRWTKVGGVWGFLFSGSIWHSWLSTSGWWVTVKTYANNIEEEVVGNYGRKYVPNENLLAELESLASSSVCGNAVVNAGEECDPPNSACTKNSISGICTSDCKCNTSVVSTCGNGVVNAGEECDPPNSACTKNSISGICMSNCTCNTAGSTYVGGGRLVNATVGTKCIDSDDEFYYLKGTVTTGSVVTDDLCQDANTLLERTCSGVALVTKTVSCAWGCNAGRCNPKPAPAGCPDAISVWSHDDKVNGRNIWFSEYYDKNVWAVSWPNAAVRTGEAASVSLLANDDNDPDVTSWPVPNSCGKAMVVWSNILSSAVALSTSSVYYSIWTHGSGWSAPALVAFNGVDPAVSADWSGKVVAVFVKGDGLYASVYTGSWSSAVKILNSADVSLPQIVWNPGTNKWYVVCYSGGSAVYLVFDGVSWTSAGVGSSVGGVSILPANRMSVGSQWGGSEVSAVFESAGNSVIALLSPVFTILPVVSGISAPDVAYDIHVGDYHVLAKGNNKERYFDKGGSVSDAADTSYVDGRPAHTYITSKADIAVWHSENEPGPFFSEVYWSRRDPSAGWSPAARLVSLGLANDDKNADIAPLFALNCSTGAYVGSCDDEIIAFNPNPPFEPVPGVPVGPGLPGIGPGGDSNGGNGGNGGAGGAGSAGSGGSCPPLVCTLYEACTTSDGKAGTCQPELVCNCVEKIFVNPDSPGTLFPVGICLPPNCPDSCDSGVVPYSSCTVLNSGCTYQDLILGCHMPGVWSPVAVCPLPDCSKVIPCSLTFEECGLGQVCYSSTAQNYFVCVPDSGTANTVYSSDTSTSTGLAVFSGRPSSDGSFVFVVIAAFAILFITLVNLFNRE